MAALRLAPWLRRSNGFAVTGTHTYGDEDSYHASVAITDTGGSTANASTTVTVNDAR